MTRYEGLYIQSFYFLKFAARRRSEGKNSKDLVLVNSRMLSYWAIPC